MRRPVVVVAAVAALALVLAAPPEAGSQEAEAQGFQNLQVLPPDIPRAELVEIMKSFTRGLGVRCQHCHVGEGDDLSTYDFASDAKEEKRAARVMLRMVQAINGEYLPQLQHAHGEEGHATAEGHHAEGGEAHAAEGEETARVTCATCHRGKPEPELDPPPAPPAEPAPPSDGDG